MSFHPHGETAEVLRILTADPSRPRITWYGEERIELSGATLGNWVAKTVNLLVEDLDMGPGRQLVLDLPVHWRSLVWALAAWRCAATVVVGAKAGEVRPDGTAVVTARPEYWAGNPEQLVAVALPALARRFDGSLPPGAIDAAADVMTYPDEIVWAPSPDPSADALVWPGGRHTFTELAQQPTPAPGRRVLLVATVPQHDLVRVFGIWRADGSVVLVSPTHEAALDPRRRAALGAAERVDDDLG